MLSGKKYLFSPFGFLCGTPRNQEYEKFKMTIFAVVFDKIIKTKNAVAALIRSYIRLRVHASGNRNYYLKSFKISSKAKSNAFLRLFCIMRIISASKTDFFFFFFLSLLLVLILQQPHSHLFLLFHLVSLLTAS